MTCHCRWRDDAGMRYLHLDYRGVPPDQYLECLATSVQLVQAEPPGVIMLIEADMIPTSSEFLSAVKRANHDVFGPRQTHKVYLGAEGVRRSIIRGLTLVAPSVQGTVFTDRTSALAALHSRRAPTAVSAAATAPTSAEDYQV